PRRARHVPPRPAAGRRGRGRRRRRAPRGRRDARSAGRASARHDRRRDRRGGRMTTGTALLVGLALLVGHAFFVVAWFAVLSARRSSIEPLAESGNRRARTVLWAMEHVSLMLACAQLGVTVCSIGLGMVAEPAIAHALAAPLAALHVPGALVHPVAFTIALAIVVYLHVVLGEMVPKNLAVSGPDTAVMWFGPPLVWIARAVNPLIVVLNRLANVFVRLGGVEQSDEGASAFKAEQVHSQVDISRL